MSSGEKEVLVDCECRARLLDQWLSAEVAQEFMQRIQSLLQAQGEKAEDVKDFSRYRFVVPPFAAFISLPWGLEIDRREIWVDLAQFMGDREETAVSLEAKLAWTPCKGEKLQYYDLEDLALLSVVPPITLVLNPRLPGQQANPVEGMAFLSVNVTDCCYTEESYRTLRRTKSLFFHVPQRRKRGIFAVDEACASLTIAMKETLKTLDKDIWTPAKSALKQAKSASLVLTPLTPSPAIPTFSPNYLPGQFLPLQTSIRADIQCLEDLLSRFQAKDSALPPAAQFYLLAERGEDGRQEIHIVNSTAGAYSKVEVWVLGRQGERLSRREIAGIQPFRNGAALSACEIEKMKSLGGEFLQIANGNEISLP